MKVLVVYCHPNPDSYIAAVRDAAIKGLDTAGHEVRLIDLYAEDFRPEMSAAERASHTDPEMTDELARHAADLTWAQALVLVYPTWWGGQPAMLKGWFDRMWVGGIAWELPDGANVLRPRLTNIRRIVMITTHGSTRLVNRLQGEPGKRVLTRSIRLMCSRLTRTRWCAMYGLNTAGPERLREFLERVEHTTEAL